MNNKHETPLEKLILKLDKRTATIGIVGHGYLRLLLMWRYADVGFCLLGINIDIARSRN